MALSKKLLTELNHQLAREFQSAYLYLAMSAYCTAENLDGAARWLLLQSKEEIAHAMKIYTYILDRDERVSLDTIDQPKGSFKSLQHMFDAALKNEVELGEHLNRLSSFALSEKDNTTHTFLDWFLTEQVEEINTCSTIVGKLKLIGDNGYGVLMMSEELGKRVDADPTPQTAAG